jgi:hypothetical protein
VVVDGQLADLTASLSVPNNNLGVAVHGACPCVRQHQLLVFAENDFMYCVIDLFF